MMRFLPFLAFVMIGCTSAGGVYRGSKGQLAAWGPISVLGEAEANGIEVVTREGDTIRIANFSTHNPDRELVGAAKTVVLGKYAADVTKHIVTKGADVTTHLDDNSTSLGAQKLSNEAAATAGEQAIQQATVAP